MLFFLLSKSRNSDNSGKQGTAEPQNISALNAEKANKGTEIDSIHSEGRRKAAHIGKHCADVAHLCFHFGIYENANAKHK